MTTERDELRESERRRRWELWGLLLLAAAPRFYRMDLISITADEGVHGLAAMRIAVFLDWPMVGLPSVGIRNSAFFLYLLALPNFFFRHPLTGAVLVAGLNLAAVFLTYRLTNRLFGRRSAFIAGLLIACSPWMIMYARNMWPPSCLAPLCLVLIDVALRWLDEGGRGRLLAIVLLGFVIPQMHFSGFCAPLWIMAVLWSGRRRLAVGPVLAAVALGLVTWIPWIAFQHFENEWIDIRQMIGTAKGKHTTFETLSASLRTYAMLLGSDGFAYWFGVPPSDLPNLFPRWLVIANRAASAALSLTFLVSLVWGIARASDRAIRLLLLWAVLPIPMLALIRPDVHPHYLLVAYPIPFVLIGALLGRRADSAAGSTWALVMGSLLVIVGLELAFLAGWYRYVAADRPNGSGHFELSYRQRRAVAVAVLDDSGDRWIQVVGAFNQRSPAYDFVYDYETMVRGQHRRPEDDAVRYWLDEREGDQPPRFRGWAVEKLWRIGPTRIFRIRRAQPDP